ncbi:dephospho-CoA kinase [Sphingobacterium deserti]|uniref:Dephospho-CoA kinase n=1 Tax=Sphingobacterium deserti TaxID=1229276 RepID=A0A0B8TA92_9SPHI|nr:dephospho-CoA kinase [Sphingobacterium deserti]KGE15729.1 dephospho-CoA kinase [Sphingobacterium deserti]
MGLKVGITGGIGSGKSYVAHIFQALGVPFYNADKEAKELMNTSATIRQELIDAFGDAVYDKNNLLDRPYLSSRVFKDSDQLARLNAIVHPVVIEHGKQWAERQTFAYSLKEAALLFESDSYKSLDFTVLVTAPEHVRIARVMARDNATEEQVKDRINKQMSDKDKMELTDFVIVNDGDQPLLPQVLKLHTFLIEASLTVK